MRIIVMALLLALAIGTAKAAILQGSDANATVVLFGSTRMPVNDENSTQEILKVDIGLVGAKNATYELMDQNGKAYSAGLYKTLSSGKQTVYFLTDIDSLFKLMNATPEGEAPIYINWWATPKASNDRMILRYYGIVDSSANSDEQAVVIQARVQNNGTKDLLVTPENFTLLDQWGWPYQPTLGFDPEVVSPNNATSDRVLIGFTGISPGSRPTALVYDFGAQDQVAIVFDRDYVPLSDEVVYGAASKTTAAQTTAPSSSAAAVTSQPEAVKVEPSTNQTQAAQTTEAAKNESTVASKISSIKEKVAASKAKLAATRQDLANQTPDTNETASAINSSLNNSSSISA
jgi:hypothetical protein